jgi:hypothetical protein
VSVVPCNDLRHPAHSCMHHDSDMPQLSNSLSPSAASCPCPCPCPCPCQVESVFLNMPNLHFIPCAPVGARFEDDVYVATSEPHGEIPSQGEGVLTQELAGGGRHHQPNPGRAP